MVDFSNENNYLYDNVSDSYGWRTCRDEGDDSDTLDELIRRFSLLVIAALDKEGGQ